MFFEKKRFCVLCGVYHPSQRMKIVHEEIGVCNNCYHGLMTTKDKNFDGGTGIKAVFSPFTYSGNMAEAVKTYKFNGMTLYGKLFGKMIYEELKSISYIWDFDFIVPVPLHGNRLLERGYNQSEIMAKMLSELSGTKFLGDVLFRVRDTKKQSSLAGLERRENVRGAFYAHPGSVSGKRVIVVDDICTMGETVRACGDALLKAGAIEVIAVTLCVSESEEKVFNLY